MKYLKRLLLCVAVLAALFLFYINVGHRPLKNLEPQDISSITVRMIPPSAQYVLTDADALSQAAALCRDLRVYGRALPAPMGGQLVEYSIATTDGSHLIVQPFGSLIWLDGVCYHTKYEPSEALNAFANLHLPQHLTLT